MPSFLIRSVFVAAMLAGTTLPFAARADEGMWLYTDPPRALLQSRYQFQLTAPWLEHLQKSSVRFNSGGSGSFISADGLVITNHHVGADTLQKLSTAQRDYLKLGFQAHGLAEEIKAPDLELNVLLSIEDVTARVNAAVAKGATNEQAFAQRRAAIAAIEKESQDQTGLRSDVVTLYEGGLFHLYRYKRYTDVRLVFAPEAQAAAFGGDPDNFEFPRYDLDICFFRAYENGQPARIEHYLKWSQAGTQPNELVFVSGHPGHTSREFTMSELEYQRDVEIPRSLQRLYRGEVLLTAFSTRSEENARRAKKYLLGVQNGRKARLGALAGLLDPQLFARKAAAEQELRARIAARPELQAALSAFDRITAAQKVVRQNAVPYDLLERADGFRSELFSLGRTLLRAGEERPKPNGDRLREYSDSARESLELGLFSTKPIYADLEQLQLGDALTYLAEQLGAASPLVQKVLAGKSPRERAADVIAQTKLTDVAFRRKLYEGGAAAVDAAHDPMIELARSIDSEARALRKIMEAQGEAKQQAYAEIGRARFALQGTGTYPDATFSLRLAFGTTVGYRENGVQIDPYTTIAGMYARAEEHHNEPPFDVAPAWQAAREAVERRVPLNFVSTADIIGGNSGSPVVNRAGEFVGIIFDGNIQSLVLDFAYEDQQARAVSVDSRGITGALLHVYAAKALLDEVTTSHRPAK